MLKVKICFTNKIKEKTNKKEKVASDYNAIIGKVQRNLKTVTCAKCVLA